MSESEKPGEEKKATPAAASDARNIVGRRKFIGWALGISSAITACLLCIPLVRESLYPVMAKGSGDAVWSDLGPAEQFASISAPERQVIKIRTQDGWREEISEKVVYVTKTTEGKVEVLTAVCPHLGCEVAWQPATGHFHCPCHGGTFTSSGKYISGPPPRGMDTLPIQVKDGHLMVQYEYFQNLDPRKQVIS